MIESSLLSTSPYNLDPFLTRDFSSFSSLDCQVFEDLHVSELDFDFIKNKENISSRSNSPVCTPSSGNSDAGEPCFPLDIHIDSCFTDLQSLNSSDLLLPANILGEPSITGELDWETFDWTNELPASELDSSVSNDSCDVNRDLPCSPVSHLKCSRSPKPLLSSSKLWSRMSAEEQLATIEALTNIISHKMGLREQLEVIRIIDPRAVVSPTDTEFVIDLGCLNDTKLQRLREHVRKYALDIPCSSNVPSVTSDHSTSISQCSTSTQSISKKEAKERRKFQKAWKQKQRKEHRQRLKERKSGLFIREEILSLSTPGLLEEEEDIEILA